MYASKKLLNADIRDFERDIGYAPLTLRGAFTASIATLVLVGGFVAAGEIFNRVAEKKPAVAPAITAPAKTAPQPKEMSR